MIKVAIIKGVDSVQGVQAYHKIMMGLTMIPAYAAFSPSEFLSKIDEMSDDDQEKVIRQAIEFGVRLETEEINDLIKWACDSNGVRFTKENIKNLTPFEFIEAMVAVCKQMASDHKIYLISEDEKKNLKISPSTLEKPSQSIPASH